MRRRQRGLNANQVFYLIREGFRNTWQNRLMALASVGVLVCCLYGWRFLLVFLIVTGCGSQKQA